MPSEREAVRSNLPSSGGDAGRLEGSTLNPSIAGSKVVAAPDLGTVKPSIGQPSETGLVQQSFLPSSEWTRLP